MKTAVFRVWRGDASGGKLVDYQTEVSEGMVVLDAIHRIQATQANDLACRWNCKAGKCGSCSAEINGRPKLMCMTRLDELPLDEPVTVEPMKAFPRIRDLATDVSWNFRVKKKIKKFKPRAPDAPDGTWRMAQADIERVQEFRKCIECFLCQDVCHVLREHQKYDEFIDHVFLFLRPHWKCIRWILRIGWKSSSRQEASVTVTLLSVAQRSARKILPLPITQSFP